MDQISKAAPKTLIVDLTAGLTTGVANTPDAMASSILAGVNPVQGLYAVMVSTPLGALFGSSAFMSITTTSALAITAGSALAGYHPTDREMAISTLALLAGAIMVIAGLLRAGRLLRFISNSVVIGFLTGVSINVILSQVVDFTGYSSAYANKVAKAIDTLLHLDQIKWQTTAIGLLTVATLLLFDHTRLRNFSMLFGMLVGSIVLILLSWTSVQQANDIATIPRLCHCPGCRISHSCRLCGWTRSPWQSSPWYRRPGSVKVIQTRVEFPGQLARFYRPGRGQPRRKHASGIPRRPRWLQETARAKSKRKSIGWLGDFRLNLRRN